MEALIALYERDLPFERHFVGDEQDRARHAELWPMGSIPVLVDDAAALTLPESTTIVEYLDGQGDAPPLVPADPAAALQARLWDRVLDAHVMSPMQKIVVDNLRPDGARRSRGRHRGTRHIRPCLPAAGRAPGGHRMDAGPAFTVADCAAAPALFYARVAHRWDEDGRSQLTRYFTALTTRPSIARVINEARPFRHVFPLPWPDYGS